MKMIGRAVALASLATGLLVSGVLAAEIPDNQGQAHHAGDQAQAATHRQNDNQDHNQQAVGTSDQCVRVHAAGLSGRIQVTGGGVHLIVLAENADDREAKDLDALADKVAAAVCGDLAASREEADAVSAADKLQGLDVLHSNTFGADDDGEDQNTKD
jgi:hypothetical protein